MVFHHLHADALFFCNTGAAFPVRVIGQTNLTVRFGKQRQLAPEQKKHTVLFLALHIRVLGRRRIHAVRAAVVRPRLPVPRSPSDEFAERVLGCPPYEAVKGAVVPQPPGRRKQRANDFRDEVVHITFIVKAGEGVPVQGRHMFGNPFGSLRFSHAALPPLLF